MRPHLAAFGHRIGRLSIGYQRGSRENSYVIIVAKHRRATGSTRRRNATQSTRPPFLASLQILLVGLLETRGTPARHRPSRTQVARAKPRAYRTPRPRLAEAARGRYFLALVITGSRLVELGRQERARLHRSQLVALLSLQRDRATPQVYDLLSSVPPNGPNRVPAPHIGASGHAVFA